MKPFSQFLHQVVAEAKFRTSSDIEHLYDVPMFSVFRHRDLSGMYNRQIKNARPVFAEARNDLMRMGFPAMHANVVFKDLSGDVNPHTGGGVGGYAILASRYIIIGKSALRNKTNLKRIIMHEWAHLWMYNNSTGFKAAVKTYYDQLLQRGKEKLQSAPIAKNDKFGDRITDAFTDDELYTLIVKTMTTMYANVYSLAILMYKEEEDEFFVVEVNDLKNEISRMVQRMITQCIEMIEKYFADKGTSVTIDEALGDAAAKSIEDYITPIILKSVNRSIEDDIYDLEDRFEDRNKLIKYLDKTETPNNFMFKIKGKSYNDLYNNFTEIDSGNIVDMTLSKLDEAVERSKIISSTKQIQGAADLSDESLLELRQQLAQLIDWTDNVITSGYELSNDDEVWAVGVDQFLNLKPAYRKEILKLMSTTGARELPNRSQRRYANIQRNRAN